MCCFVSLVPTSCGKCSQVFPVWCRSSTSVYNTQHKPKNKNWGRPGKEAKMIPGSSPLWWEEPGNEGYLNRLWMYNNTPVFVNPKPWQPISQAEDWDATCTSCGKITFTDSGTVPRYCTDQNFMLCFAMHFWPVSKLLLNKWSRWFPNVKRPTSRGRSRGSCTVNLLPWEKQLLLSFNTNGKDTHSVWHSLPCILYTGALNTDPYSCPPEVKPRPMKTISTVKATPYAIQ